VSSADLLKKHGVEDTDLVPYWLKYEVPIIKGKDEVDKEFVDLPLYGQRHLQRYDYVPECFRIPFTTPTRPDKEVHEVKVVDEQGKARM